MQLSYIELIIRTEANRQYALGHALEYAHKGHHDASVYQLLLAEQFRDDITAWLEKAPLHERDMYLNFCRR